MVAANGRGQICQQGHAGTLGDTGGMQVVQLADAAEALERAGERLSAAGAEGELGYGILERLTREPDAWGEVILLLGRLDGEPAALVSMTGEHPALICGFTDPGLIGYPDLVSAMLRAGRRPQLLNGSCRFSDPYARAWQEMAGVTATSIARCARSSFARCAGRPSPRDGSELPPQTIRSCWRPGRWQWAMTSANRPRSMMRGEWSPG